MTPPILGIWASQISGHLWAPAGAYDALATVTVPSGGVSSVTFAGIPTGYKHLQIRGIVKSTTSAQSNSFALIRFNGDSSASYSDHRLRGDGSSASAGAGWSNTSLSFGDYASSTTSNIFGAFILEVLDYSSSSKYKTVRNLNGYDANGSGQINLSSNSWQNTSAVTSIVISDYYGNLAQYSQFALYGVK